MNRWGIPDWLEREVRARDLNCIYCGVVMASCVPRGMPRNSVATWEHIVNDARIITRENIARCCSACNSSKGARPLHVWLRSAYCQRRGITPTTMAAVAQAALQLGGSENAA